MSQAMQVAIGYSARADALRAGREAAQRARAGLSSSGAQFALVFGSSWFQQEPLLQGIREVFHDVPFIGGSTAGEIVADGPVSHSCVVVLIASDELKWSIGVGKDVDTGPRKAGQTAAYAAAQRFRSQPRVGFLLFGDGLATGYAEVMRGIQEVLGTSSLIAGGMTGDDLRFSKTYQYADGRVMSRAVVGALLSGPAKMGVGIQHGFAPIGKPRRVSRAKANVLFELDGRPAASVYEEYFGHEIVERMRVEGWTRQGSAYPLGIQCDTNDQWLLRNVQSVQADSSLLCSGEVPEEAWLQLMIGSKQFALDAAYRAAQQAIQPLNRVALVLVFDSVLRRKLLGTQHAALEIARIRQAVGFSTPLAGCYTYGEQGPLGNTAVYGRTAVQTGSVLVIALGS